MKLSKKIRLTKPPRSMASVLKDSIPGDILEISVVTDNCSQNKVPTMEVTNLTTGESTTNYFNRMSKLINNLSWEEVE